MEAIIAIGAAVAVLTGIEQASVSVSQQEKRQKRSQDSRKQRVRSVRI